MARSTRRLPRAAIDDGLVLRTCPPDAGASSRRRVLVIEDDPSIRQLLLTRLANEGFESLEAADGETGLHLAARAATRT